MSTAQAVTALDQFLQWLNAVPSSWHARYLVPMDAVATDAMVGPITKPMPVEMVSFGNVIVWPKENHAAAQAAWEILSQASVVLAEFPFQVTPATGRSDFTVNATTIQAVKNFLARATSNLGYEIPVSTGVASGVAWWKVISGVAAAALVIGGGFYLIRKYADRPSVERYATPPQPRSRPIYASW
jgi:hypothetical protein